LTIAGYLQVSVVDKSTSDYLVIANGEAAILENRDFECELSLTPHSKDEKKDEKQVSVIVQPEQVNFGIVDCNRGFHKDLWVETEASLIVENIQSLAMKFYLPESKDHKNKNIEFLMDSKKVGYLDLRRGEPQEIWLDLPNPDGGPRELILKCDYKDPNATDERNLGMIFVEYNVNLTKWKPAGDLL